MLTWSDWKTEPRSNRFHYATRFARHLPVLFVQPYLLPGSELCVELTDVPQLEIVHFPGVCGASDVNDFKKLLWHRGIKRPLLWVYSSLHYDRIIQALPYAFVVYHATEDYFADAYWWSSHRQAIADSLRHTVRWIDLLVGVSAGVVESYRQAGEYKGPAVVIENGCDAEFFQSISRSLLLDEREMKGHKVAIFQGGINLRLDYSLLLALVRLLPDWDFQFCGREQGDIEGWCLLKEEPNVQYLGFLAPADMATAMCQATVGILPFLQDDLIKNSLPLKSYEYVACGLPVVTVPISSLDVRPDLFAVATTATEFASAIEASVPKRWNQSLIQERECAARDNSYEKRFLCLTERLICERELLAQREKKLNIVILYDDRSVHINTIQEHLKAFPKYSKNNFSFFPATGLWPANNEQIVEEMDFSVFDALVLHYSVRVSLRDHLSDWIAELIQSFNGLKILFIQDEYDTTEIARVWIEKLRFDIVYTCVPAEALDFVYPKYRFPGVDFLPTLTGYIPEDPGLESFVTPMGDRNTLIAYRGRKLPYVYGTLGYEKYRIGVDVKKLAVERGFCVDIEVDDSKRIYGSDWYRFLGSARATLGTESGSNVFDFDGTLTKDIKLLVDKDADVSFEVVHQKLLADHEGNISMNQISPKIFEAIRLRTVLVLFEGQYSGIVQPHIHYIPLKKDYSNIDDVFAKLQDVEYLVSLTDKAYEDVIESDRYSYRSFVQGIDRDIESRVIKGPLFKLLYRAPVVAVRRDGDISYVGPLAPVGSVMSDILLGNSVKREEVLEAAGRRLHSILNVQKQRLATEHAAELQSALSAQALFFQTRTFKYRVLRRIWSVIPLPVRKAVRAFVVRVDTIDDSCGFTDRVGRSVWQSIPENIRVRISGLIVH